MAIEDVPDNMLAAQVIQYNEPYAFNTVPTPTSLSEYDLLLKVKVASLCHTDSMVSAGTFSTKLPCTASHEGCGEVVALGPSVKDFQKGDRVMAGIPYNRCGHCPDCLGPAEFKHYCPNLEGHLGVTTHGAFAEYMLADARESSRIPDTVTYETAAPMACAGITIWGGLVNAGLKAGETVALVGAGGGLGHLGCQFAKALGLQIVGIDARDQGLDLARSSGAHVVIDARIGKEKVVEEVHKVTDGKGVDSALTISDAPDAAALACALTKMHGTMIQIAQPPEVSVPFHELIFRDIRIHGSLISPRLKSESIRMLDFVADHRITVKTNPFFGLKEIPHMVELAHSGKMAGKGVVIIDEDEIRKEKERRGVS
ncbi:MAG: hypothetical protein Q9186_003325 [Xanthomendoza sp. 1 TL-2023]